MTGAEYAISTTSGLSRTVASTSGAKVWPSLGRAATRAGWLENSSTPTMRSQASSAHSDSVSEGSSETMRCGTRSRRTWRPRMSVTV